MTAYNFTRSIPQEVAAKKAARRKVIERARQLERESYKALMQKKRRLHAASEML
jgi:hypothetical protein